MTYILERTGGLRSRGLLFGFILLGHVGFFWLMNTGLVSGSKIAERIFEVVDVVEPVPKEEPLEAPPPPPDRIEIQKVELPPPSFRVGDSGPAGEGAITQAGPLPDGPTLTPPPVLKKIMLPMANPRTPLSQPPYPSASQRLNEEGRVVLDLYVLANGRVGEARVAQSSGYPRLDQAAVEEAKRAWRLLPGTENGQPKAMWLQFGVIFRLSDRG